MTDVLVTGGFGRVGTSVREYCSEDYDLTLLDKDGPSDTTYIDADITDGEAVAKAMVDHDAVVHLAGTPDVNADWDAVISNNIIGIYNCLHAACEAAIDTFVFASSNHVVGMYETEHAPALYDPEYDLSVNHNTTVRPDSLYATSKVFGEALGRYFIERRDYPKQFYALRIASLRSPTYDHPYGDAERGVDEGEWERDSDAYNRAVRRMRATWLSRQDMAQLTACCLEDDSVDFDVFYGVSDNKCRWFDIDHARSVLDYRPQDSADDYDAPPS